jgi:8-oxo-dGTP diphosphatase
MTAGGIPVKIPYVGVGCIVVRDSKLLLVRDQRRLWSTPGGHLDFGESPDVCAAREVFEETGVTVSNIQFVAITNDVLADIGQHYLTVWMRGDADGVSTQISDTAEINELGWFSPNEFPVHCIFISKTCLRVVAGPDHRRTCHSPSTPNPDQAMLSVLPWPAACV